MGRVRSLQSTPLVDVTMVAFSPTATKRPFPKATLRREFVTADSSGNHASPLEEVRMVPRSPTAANKSPLNATLRRSAELPELRSFHRSKPAAGIMSSVVTASHKQAITTNDKREFNA